MNGIIFESFSPRALLTRGYDRIRDWMKLFIECAYLFANSWEYIPIVIYSLVLVGGRRQANEKAIHWQSVSISGFECRSGKSVRSDFEMMMMIISISGQI